MSSKSEKDTQIMKRKDAEMPGAHICDKCGFIIQKNILFTVDGSIRANTCPLNELCPNDGTLMRPYTWREANETFFEDNQQLRNQLAAAKLEIDRLNAELDNANAIISEERNA